MNKGLIFCITGAVLTAAGAILTFVSHMPSMNEVIEKKEKES